MRTTFSNILGLEPHLREHQLEKFGLRYFFPADGNRRIEARFELGPSGFPPVPSFQLDRGRLENILLQATRDAGVEVRGRCRGASDLDRAIRITDSSSTSAGAPDAWQADG